LIIFGHNDKNDPKSKLPVQPTLPVIPQINFAIEPSLSSSSGTSTQSRQLSSSYLNCDKNEKKIPTEKLNKKNKIETL
jgi:hypothetical protein